MKGQEKIIEKLNALLGDELTAVNQYIVHAEMCENWGYKHLHEIEQKRAIDEMKHAEKLIARIIFLEGRQFSSMKRITSTGLKHSLIRFSRWAYRIIWSNRRTDHNAL